MRKLFVFCHIPKTGGTSFQSFLINNFGDYNDGGRWARFPRGDSDSFNWDKIDCISGHFPYGFHQIRECFPDRELVYMTLLREPVERTWSYYSFWLLSQDPDIKLLPTEDIFFNHFLPRFIGKDNEYWIKDCMCYYLGDGLKTNNVWGWCVDDIELMTHDLVARYPDHFHTTKMEYKNKTPNKVNVIPDDIKSKLIELNKNDIAIYKWAVGVDVFFNK